MKQLKIISFILFVIFNFSNLSAQNVEIIGNYPVSLSDSINTFLNPELYINIQCNEEFDGVAYADISSLEIEGEKEIMHFFNQCPYKMLSFSIVAEQKIVSIKFNFELLNEEQKQWNCNQWASFFKTALTEQRENYGIIDFRE